MSLVDYSRRARQIIPDDIEGFDRKKNEAFSGDPPHEFIQDLRNFAAHYDVPTPEWEFRIIWHKDERGKEEQIDLFIDSDNLLKYDDWKSASREYFSRNRRVGISEMFAQYRGRSLMFNNWFLSALEEAAGEDLRDYRRSVRIVEKIRWRVRINMAISRINDTRESVLVPFWEHLTDREQEELKQYPDRSDVQLRRLREILNIFEAFEDDLYEKLIAKARE